MEDMNGMLKMEQNKMRQYWSGVANWQIADSTSQTHHHPSVILRGSELAGKVRKLGDPRLGRGGSKSNCNPKKMNTPQEHRIGHPLLYESALLLELFLKFLKRV